MPEPDNHQPPTLGCVSAILLAAGSGQRFGGAQNKLLTTLAGKPIWQHSVERLKAESLIGRVVMAISESDQTYFHDHESLLATLGAETVVGGAERTDSVRACLERLADEPATQFVAVHDGARPLVSAGDLAAVLAIAWQTGAAILSTPVTGTLKRTATGQEISETVDRRDLWLALTPQVFRLQLLRDAYAAHRGRPATDDAELVERIGHSVSLVRGSSDNLKITHPEDLSIAEAILARPNQHA